MSSIHLLPLYKHIVSLFLSFLSQIHNSNGALPDKGKGCELLTEKTYASIKDETLATIFAMAQQNSMKLACQLTFEQTLYVYFMKL